MLLLIVIEGNIYLKKLIPWRRVLLERLRFAQLVHNFTPSIEPEGSLP
jgi:hypothetical protein